ncbi:ROK family protein [Mycoplasmopsis lipofaciens]|uniref:ROK family protein n=1 Tax=Mycoplasmopsis lipofaciens TaxID=114884 RepID=UPI000488C1C8|nr:ROK family protein [Mycoplasmopsis lipofaciens]
MKKNENKIFAAVDIGGTNTRFALFDKNGKIAIKEKTLSSHDNVYETCDWIINLLNKYEVNYLALCVPGPSDYENGIILNSPNLKGSWLNFNMKEYLFNKSNLKDIIFENDANAMAFANHKIANIPNNEISQFFTISTGFGAGLIINGKIYHGNKYYAQEIAQMPISSKPFLGEHHFKNDYALELHCSGTGIKIKSKHRGVSESAKETFVLAKNGNKGAKEIIDNAIDTLAKLIATDCALLAPNHFFFGGSVALYNPELVYQAIDKAKQMSDIVHFKNITFEFDKLGDDSALYGLYFLIKDKNK